MRYGKAVADDLDADGLITPNSKHTAKDATGWRVYVKRTGPLTLDTFRSGGLRAPRSFGSILANTVWSYIYPNTNPENDYYNVTEASQDFPSEGVAKRQASIAKKVGLEVEIVPLITIEMSALRYTP